MGVRGKLLGISMALIAAGTVLGLVLIEVLAEAPPEGRTKLHLLLLALAGVATVVAVFMSALASHVLARTLRKLVDRAAALERDPGGERREAARREAGEQRHREEKSGGSGLPSPVYHQLGHLAGSLERLAEELAANVSQLSRERDRFAAVLEAIRDGVLALDGEGRIALMNRSAMDLLGLSPSHVGRSLIELVRNPALHEHLRRARSGGVPDARELDLAVVGSARRRVLGLATPLRAAPGVVLVLRDLTELRRLERVRSDFVANVSHELRTPVAVIRANTETLLHGALDQPEEARRFASTILRHTERLGQILSDLLDLSSIEAGRAPLEPREMDVGEVVQNACDTLRPQAESRSASFAVEVNAGPCAWADPRAVDQILLNLLDNALKYGPEGGTVRIRTRSEGEEVLVEVCDEGPGVPPHQRIRIFERFYRLDPGRGRGSGGTGLGLAIVKHLAESMGGAVGVEEGDPAGSVFWVRLPSKSHGLVSG